MTHHWSAAPPTQAHVPAPREASAAAPGERPRFLSEAECHDVAQRLARVAAGGGYTTVRIVSTWRGTVRWARNLISGGSQVRQNRILVNRSLNGAESPWVEIDEITDAALVAAARRAERLARFQRQHLEADLPAHFVQEESGFSEPNLFSEATYQVDAHQCSAMMQQMTQPVVAAGLLAAGTLQTLARSQAFITSYGWTRYCQYTWARASLTVRDPQGTGSGWAGVDWPEWNKIDGRALTARALDKCLKSRNPVAVEPGRYTTILEPQAVCDFVGLLVFGFGGPGVNLMQRRGNEVGDPSNWPFNNKEKKQGTHSWKFGGTGDGSVSGDGLTFAKWGERVIDARLSLGADPQDPELGFPVFEGAYISFPLSAPNAVYHPATWIEQGVLKNLAYEHSYGVIDLKRTHGLENPGAFRMSVTGPTTSVDEMITTTKRGLLVTRFDPVTEDGATGAMARGYTRDGLWLIENGKISKPCKNLAFTESILFALNNVEEVGAPARVFHPNDAYWFSSPQPVIVPPLKIRDFSFTALADAV